MGGGASERGPAALRGSRGRGGPGDPGPPGGAGRGDHRPRPRDRQRDDQLHPDRDGAGRDDVRRGAGRGAAARLRGGGSVRGRRRARRGGEDGDPGAAGLRHAGPPRPGALRGDRAHPARRPRVRRRARAPAQADRDRGAGRRRAVGPGAPGVPVSRAPPGVGQRPVQRGDRRVRGDHRDHHVGPGRRGPADRERGARRRDQRDDPARLDASDLGGAGDRRRRGVGVLSASGGGRRARGAGACGAGAGRAGRVGQVGRAARSARPGAACDGRAPRARVALRGRDGVRSRGSTCCAPLRGRSGCSRRSSGSVRRR